MKSTTYEILTPINYMHPVKTIYCPTCSEALPHLPVLYPINEESVLMESSMSISALHDPGNADSSKVYPYVELGNHPENTTRTPKQPEWLNFLDFLRGW